MAQADPHGRITIMRETKGRKGKAVTLVKGVAGNPEELLQLSKKLKALCGSGGTIKSAVIEIQGDHRQKLYQYFQKNHNQKVVLAGS